jgi:transcription factor E
MQIKLLHDLVEEMAGENTGRIVDILFGKKDVNEFLIAKKMELTINQVRNILYKLSADGLVSFIRKKDKRKGWYIYYWTLNTEKCLLKLEASLNKKIGTFNNILKNRETKRFYICKSCAIEVSEETALDHGFSCEECAEIYELSDNSGSIRDTKAQITRTEKNLSTIQGELEEIKKKKLKKRERSNKKLEKEEAKKKELIKMAKMAAKKKIAKKVVKKKVAKKVVKKKVVKKATKKKVIKKVVKKKIVKKAAKKIAKKVVKKKTTKKVVKKKVVKKKVVKKVVKKTVKKLSLANKLKKKLSKRKR